jgi:hypothetical protein
MSLHRRINRRNRRRELPAAWILAFGAVIGGAALALPPRAHAVPTPDVDYLYNVTYRRHYTFPNNVAIGYGHGICDKVSGGESFALLMGNVKTDVTPNDEYSANYLVSYAVSQFCPDQIWQLRNSAAGYHATPGSEAPVGGLQGDVAGN